VYGTSVYGTSSEYDLWCKESPGLCSIQRYSGFRCSSPTFNCLNCIDNYENGRGVRIVEMVLADWTRIQIRGRGTYGVLGDAYYVPEFRNC